MHRRLEFIINDNNKIVLFLEEALDELHCCSEASIQLFHNGKKFHETCYSVREYLITIKHIAENALNHKAQLHKSITQNIGFLLNEELQYKPGLYFTDQGKTSWWVGYEYCLSMAEKVGMWLYNDIHGGILFEATPIFPFTYRNYAKDPNYVPYKTWIKTYKPYFITEASAKSIQKWPILADAILIQIEENIQKMFRETNG